MRVSRTSGTVAGVAPNKAELIRDLETATSIPLQGQTATLSFYARAGATFSATTNNTITVDTFTGIGTDQNLTTGYTPATEYAPPIPIGTKPSAITLNSATNTLYVTNEGTTPGTTIGTVSAIDGTTGAIKSTVNVQLYPRGIARNATTSLLYVTNFTSNTVSVIYDVAMAVTTTITVGTGPIGVAVYEPTNTVYVANYTANTVSIINGATGAVTSTVAVGTGPSAVAVNPVTNRIYVTNGTAGTVSVINGATGLVIATTTVGTDPNGVAVNSVTNTIYVANSTTGSSAPGTVSVISGATSAVTTTINGLLGSPYQGIAVNSTTNTIFVTNVIDFMVTIINGISNTITRTVPVGTTAKGIAINAITNKEYVVNQDDNSLIILNGTLQVGQTSTPITLTTSWARYSVPISVPVSTTQLGFSINYTPTASSTAGANEYFDITGVQLEGGSVVTPFRRSTPSIQEELARCQRTYYAMTFPSSNMAVAFGAFATSAVWGGLVSFPVTMRSSPTSNSGSAATNFRVVNATGAAYIGTGSLNFPYATPYNCSVTLATATFSSGTGGLLISSTGTGIYIDFSAEL
jgi:YVTN family beta-propeller protein